MHFCFTCCPRPDGRSTSGGPPHLSTILWNPPDSFQVGAGLLRVSAWIKGYANLAFLFGFMD